MISLGILTKSLAVGPEFLMLVMEFVLNIHISWSNREELILNIAAFPLLEVGYFLILPIMRSISVGISCAATLELGLMRLFSWGF